jgi:hypothetical protein
MKAAIPGALSLAFAGAIVSFAACSPLKVPAQRVSTQFHVPYPFEEVRRTLPVALAHYLVHDKKLKLDAMPPEEPFVYESRSSRLTLSQTADGQVVLCTYQERPHANTLEHWNVLLEADGDGTSIRLYRHIRKTKNVIPLTDGESEQKFLDTLIGEMSGERHD